MSIVIESSWQFFELQEKVPKLDSTGEPEKDEHDKPVLINKPTGVTMEVKPLDMPSFQKIMVLFKDFKSGVSVQEQTDRNNPVMNPEIVNIMCDILPTHVRKLSGVQVQDETGNLRDADINDMLGHGSMMMYLVSILLKIFAISNINKEEREKVKKFLGE